MQEFAAEGSLRRGYRRLKPGDIANAGGAAIPFDLLFMDFEDFIQRQEEGIHCGRHSFGKSLERLPVPLVRPFLCSAELLPPCSRLDWRNDEALAVCTDIQRRFRVDFQQVENWTIDHERHAVSVLFQLLEHFVSVLPMYHQWKYVSRAIGRNVDVNMVEAGLFSCGPVFPEQRPKKRPGPSSGSASGFASRALRRSAQRLRRPRHRRVQPRGSFC